MTAHAFLSLASAFGLATAAGLKAYIPLFTVALLSRITPWLITLHEPYDALGSWYVIVTLGVLMLIEMLVDKIPVLDTVDNVVHTFIRPAAGALLFAASTDVIGLHPVLAAVCGVVVAGGVHVVKSGVRPVVTATTAAVGDPIVGTVEDVLAFTTSLIAVIAPYVLGVLLAGAVLLFVWWYRRRRQCSR